MGCGVDIGWTVYGDTRDIRYAGNVNSCLSARSTHKMGKTEDASPNIRAWMVTRPKASPPLHLIGMVAETVAPAISARLFHWSDHDGT